MSKKPKLIADRPLRRGIKFRIANPNLYDPFLYVWDGEFEVPDRCFGYICRRLFDDSTKVLYPADLIREIDPPEKENK